MSIKCQQTNKQTCIGLVNRPILLDADIFVNSRTLLLILGGAFLSGRWLAKSLQFSVTHLLILGHTDLQ